MNNNLNTDMAIATGAITSPVWLAPLNEWMALTFTVLGISLAVIRIYQSLKKKDDV
jgi:hypothetical protein